MISAVVLAKNEQGSLPRTLSSLKFADEVIVVDDQSTDKTAEVAKQHGAQVVVRPIDGDFASQRNFAQNQAKGEWILFVDADEVVTTELASDIEKALQNPDFDAYYIKRRDFWWGRELRYGETRKARTQGIIRLVKKGSGQWYGKVHETFQPEERVSRLSGFLDHYPHPTLKEFITEINSYSTLRAKELQEKGKMASIFELIFYPIVKFQYTYFFLLGFLDGPVGFVYSFLMSFHSFLVRAKLYQYQELDKR